MYDIKTKIILVKKILPELLNIKCSKYHTEKKYRWYITKNKIFKKYEWYLIHYKKNGTWKYAYISRERLNFLNMTPSLTPGDQNFCEPSRP